VAKRKHASKTAAASRERIPVSSPTDHWPKLIGMVVLGCLAQAFAVQSILGSEVTATRFVSGRTWHRLVQILGGQVQFNPVDRTSICDVPFFTLFAILIALSILTLAGFAMIARFTRQRQASPNADSPTEQTCRVGVSGWRWWLLPWLWEMARILVFTCGFETIMILMTAVCHYVMAVSLAGWITELSLPLMKQLTTPTDDEEITPTGGKPGYRVSVVVLVGLVAYVVVFTAMNWQLYRGLLVPHGDSVMYEEHLWNVLHGKGFRSYLDQGLFLGEHIQVIHLALLPFYAIWPSHLLLELCESIALASGAIPVFWIARRWSGSASCAVCLALAYLLYPPLQFLDIAIDLKTFRPICFGVSAMLFALDQLERGRIKSTAALFLVALASKEDFALVMAPLGLWLAVQPFLKSSPPNKHDSAMLLELLTSRKLATRYGIGLAIGSVGYLLLTTRVLIPWFRDGAEVHYARYFAKFGDSMSEIVMNMLTQPGLLIQEMVTVSSIGYLLALLLPLLFLPLLSPTRFFVAGPILGLLCLNEVVKADPQPWHHFHAPAIPILFWAAAHSLRKFRAGSAARPRNPAERFFNADRRFVAVFALTLCCSVGAVTGMSPLSFKFWDSGSFFHWRKLYVPSERALQFARVLEQIPPKSRVASTDFVHPRFTHHKRSYDYSHYRRKVAGYENRVSEDTDFIVIDTQHYYSDIKSPDELRELRTEPDNWELLEDRTSGYFIILKRRE
jgi:uncharacterized membrane protein